MTSTAGTATAMPPAEGAAIPYLAVPIGAGRRALEWYVRVLGAEQAGEPVVMPDGRIGHAELRVSGGRLFLSEAHPEIGVVAPEPERTSVSLVLTVPDVASTVAKAGYEGARITRPLYDDYGSRNAVMVDPFGHRWFLQTPLSSLPMAYGPGDIGYVSLFVPDVERAVAFYAAVLGWTYAPGSGPQGRQVRDTLPAQGLWGGQRRSTAFCSFAVRDVAEAAQRVRAAGGQASEPEDRPHGPTSDCVDDQGVPFSLYQTAGGGSRPPANGARPGDLSYVTLEVVDSARARAFLGAVLGWTFTGGQIEDGWGVERIVPMTGLSGGHAEATGVPMWRVDDVAAAVERVRAAGGTATDPQRKPYGTTVDCTDDQGTRFYLLGS
ncbi:MAG TPA: VOC family protein [Mycobacteriales bacterium]|nr:VOC family protein [Mycobacteriales bacterium]